MDFTNYPNIAAQAAKLGKLKKTVINKKKIEEADRTWAQLSPEDLERINEEVVSAKKVLQTLVMPSAILFFGWNTLFVIPTRDIIWLYGSVTTCRMNFIPYMKEHQVFLLTRRQETFMLGMTTTGPITKKRPSDDAIEQIREVLSPYRKGIIYGWSEQVQKFIHDNFAGAVSYVDQKSNE